MVAASVSTDTHWFLMVELKLTCAWHWWWRRGRGWCRHPWSSAHHWSHAVICYRLRTVESSHQSTPITYSLLTVFFHFLWPNMRNEKFSLLWWIDLWYIWVFKEIIDDQMFLATQQNSTMTFKHDSWHIVILKSVLHSCLLFYTKISFSIWKSNFLYENESIFWFNINKIWIKVWGWLFMT